MRSMTVRYVVYKRWRDVPEELDKSLAKLSLGPYLGIMHDLAEQRRGRNIVIAMHRGKPIGWAITDQGKTVNFYTKRSLRGHKIAQHLADIWVRLEKEELLKVLRRQRRGWGWDRLDFGHTEAAADLVIAAMARNKISLPKSKKGRKFRIKHVMPTIRG